jgi:hypothetical protein
MKKYFFIYFIFHSLCLFAQTNDNKRDNVWIFGYDSYYNLTNPLSGNTILDFKTNPPLNYFQYTEMNIDSDIAIISDTLGQLLFYTNGIYIADKTHQPMENGKGLNPGKQADKNNKNGYICEQGSLILPVPDNPNLYYLIHSSYIIEFDNPPGYVKGDKLYYTVVDMSKNDGKGEVIEKNKVIIGNKYHDSGKITACRHANGKDWWIIVADFDVKNYNILLLTKNGIEIKNEQKFPLGDRSGLGQAVFSPDGTKYARFNAISDKDGTYIDVFDFDRCTGKLSNQKEYHITTDIISAGGIAISPNSKYLYVSAYTKIYQYDLTKEDVFATIDTVAKYDGNIDKEFGGSTKFFLNQLAPDGKIYISTTNTTRYLHIIHEPDKKGKACNVEQHGFKLARKNYTTMPNFPNFRLGKANVLCTTDVAENEEKETFKIYPNPNTGDFTLENEANKANNIVIYTMDGKVVFTQKISEGQNFISTNNLNNGIYFLQIKKDNLILQTEKMSIIK